VTVEATSGRSITVETLATHTSVFHDRDYNFDTIGHFQGKTFIKYSNDDKVTDHMKVMTKIRTLEPLTVYIVKLDAHSLPWLSGEGYTSSAYTGVSFSGVRATRDKEWDPSLLTTDHFDAFGVYSKTFPAGTISIPGNSGGDGSFLIFVDHPSPDDQYDSNLQAYWDSGICGAHGEDHHWDWCGRSHGNCPLEVATDLCPSGTAELAAFHGTGESNSYTRDGCNYMYLAQYRCSPHVPTNGEAEFIGCFVDDGNRDLGDMVGTAGDATTNTFALCRARCADHLYMSLQFGGECFCSNSYSTAAQYSQVDESECSGQNGNAIEPCHSNSYNCGGTWRNAVYQINHPAVQQYYMMGYGTGNGAPVGSTGPGHANCPEGKAIDTEEECEAAHLALGLEVAPKWAGTLGSIPGGCSTREINWGGQHHFHWNNQAVGSIRGDLSPVCRV
jgi:hypothetical protein